MVDPFLGEIKMFTFNWNPRGWAFCDGSTLTINQNQALYSLLGLQFGGNASSFNLPDLRGRVPVGTGDWYNTGNTVGVESVTLQIANMPAHEHAVYGSSSNAAKFVAANANDILGVVTDPIYAADTGTNAAMNASTVTVSGGSQAHNNIQPSLVQNYCIALSGVYPSRN